MPETRRNFMKMTPYAGAGVIAAGTAFSGAKNTRANEKFKPFGKRTGPAD